MNKKGVPGIKLIIGFIMLTIILFISWYAYGKGVEGFKEAANSCEGTAIGKCVPKDGGCDDGVIITKESCEENYVCCVTSSSGDGEIDTMTGRDSVTYPQGAHIISIPVAPDATECEWNLRYQGTTNYLVRTTTYPCTSPIRFTIVPNVPDGSILDLDTRHYNDDGRQVSSSKTTITVS